MTGKSRCFAVADAHGNWSAVEGLLADEGLIEIEDDSVRRVAQDVLLVQLGDLMNCVYESVDNDLNAMREAVQLFDVLLPGNHEFPYWPGGLDYRFSGFHWDQRLKDLIIEYESFYRPAVAWGNTLLSHAGLSSEYDGQFESASDAERWLDLQWGNLPTAPVFSNIGSSRGGRHRKGGILWSDWSEGKCKDFNQLVGHSVGDDVRRREHPSKGTVATCIDLGAKRAGSKIAGAWVNRDGSLDIRVYNPLGA